MHSGAMLGRARNLLMAQKWVNSAIFSVRGWKTALFGRVKVRHAMFALFSFFKVFECQPHYLLMLHCMERDGIGVFV